MKKLLIGTFNKAKLNTYKKLLKDFPLELVSLEDLEITEESPETGNNFEETAIEKAKFYYEKSGIPTLVDDGGFEIKALDGEPGVKSKRWLGYEASDEELINAVIDRMKDVPDEERQCKMTVIVAIASPFGIITSHGDVEGVVPKEPSKIIQPKLPYRSTMMIPNYGKYFSELTNEELQILDHRGHAIEKIKDILIEISK